MASICFFFSAGQFWLSSADENPVYKGSSVGRLTQREENRHSLVSAAKRASRGEQSWREKELRRNGRILFFYSFGLRKKCRG